MVVYISKLLLKAAFKAEVDCLNKKAKVSLYFDYGSIKLKSSNEKQYQDPEIS